jgi:hypothetical protein
MGVARPPPDRPKGRLATPDGVVRPPLSFFFFFIFFFLKKMSHPLRPWGWFGHLQTGQPPPLGWFSYPFLFSSFFFFFKKKKKKKMEPPPWPKGWPAIPVIFFFFFFFFLLFFLIIDLIFKIKLKINILMCQKQCVSKKVTKVNKI